MTSVQVIPAKIVSVDCIYVISLPTVCQSDPKVLLPAKRKTVFSPPSLNTFEKFLDKSFNKMVGLKVHGNLKKKTKQGENVTSTSSKLEPVIWSRDTGKQTLF